MDADASMCRDGSLPSVPPALLSILTDKDAACGGRNVTSGRCAARPDPRPLRIDFCIVLTDFKIDWSIIGVSGGVDGAAVHLSQWTPVASCSLYAGAVCPT